jgi:AraC-like DNA-binding protein
MLILFVSSFVIIFISKYQYKPIKTLAKYTNSLTGKIINSGKNELDSVRIVLQDMNEHTKELDEEILKSRPALKDYYFDNLVTGQYESINQYNQKSKNSGIILTNKSFAIARYGFTCTNDSIPLPAQTIIGIIESHSLEKIQLYAKSGMKSNIITVLICANYKYSGIIEHLYKIGNLFYEKYNLQYSVGLGEIYNTVQNLGKSYLEAELALSYRMISGNNKVIPIRKIMESNEEYEVHYPSGRFRSLEYAITEGDVETITKELSAISAIIKSEDIPLFTARCISYDIINTVVRTMSSAHTKFLFSKQNYPDVMLLAQYKSLDDLVSIVNGICIDICKQILDNKENNPEAFTRKVLNYIDSHAFEHDFSLLKIAESLGISQSLISHQFKKQTGQTVISYVNFLRIEKAKKLLLETDLQVVEIVNQIGYYDVSSFTRKFKKEVGVTPGKFRKNSTSKK